MSGTSKEHKTIFLKSFQLKANSHIEIIQKDGTNEATHNISCDNGAMLKKKINVSCKVKRQKEISKSKYHQNDNPNLMSPHILKTYTPQSPQSCTHSQYMSPQKYYLNNLSLQDIYEPAEPAGISFG